jgi:ribose transport system ATP-binding protein
VGPRPPAGGSILALLGENGAGKSTLVKIIDGVYKPDSGTIEVGGRVHHSFDPRSARRAGIRMIFQEFQDAPTLSVAENISLGRLPARFGVVNKLQMVDRAKRVLAQMGVDLDPKATVGNLRVGQRQIVEIARALSDEARLLILDEPTAALSQQEVAHLFALLRRLRDQGVALIYITHRLYEVQEVADRVQVLRDGSVAALGNVEDFTVRDLVSAMIGREAGQLGRPPEPAWPLGKEPAISFLAASSDQAFSNVDFDVRPGEVVALYGKLGSGTAEVAETVFGLRRLDAGAVRVGGRWTSLGPHRAIRNGVGFVPADRAREAGLMVRPVAENVAVPSWPRLAWLGAVITRVREARAYRRWHDELSIRSRNDPLQPLGTLSGGNQQKVILARWLERGTPALVMVEPTRGVDVGARGELYRAMRRLASEGVGILVATSDYEEVVQVADRAIVMSGGRTVASLDFDEITTSRLLEAAGG